MLVDRVCIMEIIFNHDKRVSLSSNALTKFLHHVCSDGANCSEPSG